MDRSSAPFCLGDRYMMAARPFIDGLEICIGKCDKAEAKVSMGEFTRAMNAAGGGNVVKNLLY